MNILMCYVKLKAGMMCEYTYVKLKAGMMCEYTFCRSGRLRLGDMRTFSHLICSTHAVHKRAEEQTLVTVERATLL